MLGIQDQRSQVFRSEWAERDNAKRCRLHSSFDWPGFWLRSMIGEPKQVPTIWARRVPAIDRGLQAQIVATDVAVIRPAFRCSRGNVHASVVFTWLSWKSHGQPPGLSR